MATVATTTVGDAALTKKAVTDADADGGVLGEGATGKDDDVEMKPIDTDAGDRDTETNSGKKENTAENKGDASGPRTNADKPTSAKPEDDVSAVAAKKPIVPPGAFSLTSPIAMKTLNQYPSGIKYTVQCVYCNSKWKVELGADNLVCSCGNQLFIMGELTRSAYENLKTRLVKQLMAHYKKFHTKSKEDAAARLKAKAADADRKKNGAGTPTGSVLGKRTLSPQSADGGAEKKAKASSSPVAIADTTGKVASSVTKAGSPSSGKVLVRPISRSKVEGSAAAGKSTVAKSLASKGGSAGSKGSSPMGNRPKITLPGSSPSVLSTKKVDQVSKSGSPSTAGRTSNLNSPRTGGGTGSAAVAKKKHTLIVQCPKCKRNVIVPGVLVFQCPCGQYMTIQKPDSPKIGGNTISSGNTANASSTPSSSTSSSGKSDGPGTKAPQKSPLSKQTFPVSSPKSAGDAGKKGTPSTESKEE